MDEKNQFAVGDIVMIKSLEQLCFDMVSVCRQGGCFIEFTYRPYQKYINRKLRVASVDVRSPDKDKHWGHYQRLEFICLETEHRSSHKWSGLWFVKLEDKE